MKKFLIIFSILFMAILFFGCSYSQNPSSQNTSSFVSTSQANAVTIQNFTFNPATLTIKAGATVTWTNQDSATHRIKSDAFDSSDLGNGQSFSFTFKNVGVFNYNCSIHPSMTGKIIVQ